mgnify:CR=1 FL=1
MAYAPGKAYNRSNNDLVDAKMDVNGSVTAIGAIYTTKGGANICSSNGTGKYIQQGAPGTATATYQYNANGNSAVTIPITAAKLHNADGTYTETSSASAGDVINYVNGVWGGEASTELTVTFEANGSEEYPAEGTMAPQSVTAKKDTALNANTFTREGYNFLNWNTAADGTGDSYADGATVNLTENTTLYAQWEDNHSLTKVINKKDATCTEDGYTGDTVCAICGKEIIKGEAIEAKGHIEAIDAAVEPTCTEPGKTEGKHCSVCNEVLVAQKVVSAKGHDWDSGKILKQPTYGENGEMLYTCAICDEYKTEIIPKLVNGGGGTGGAGGGSSSAGSTTKTETTINPDESTTKTETKPDGTVVETTTGKDGSTSKTTTKKDGSSVTESKTADGTTGTVKTDKDGKTEAEAKISNKAVEDAKKSSEAVKVPTEVKAGKDSNSAPTVKVELPKNAGETKIEIPVSNVNSGTVAVIVHEDGTEEIVKNSKPTEDGVQLTVDGNTVVKIIDNSKDFIDTRNHWSRDEVNFVASRDIFNGVGNNLFGVSQPMTRGMVNTVLARLAGIDTTPKNGQKWYEVGTEWAKSKGITDGTNPEASVTREQLATLLYRFYGSPAISGTLRFADAGAVSAYAQDALLWATQNGIMNGVGNNCVAPSADAQRAQVAAMMARYLKNAD